jgi:hypothetical protein
LSPALDLLPAPADTSVLERAILETLAYSDVFDYPLRLDELHRYLTVAVSLPELVDCLPQCEKINTRDGYYFLKGREEIIQLRGQKEQTSRRAYDSWAIAFRPHGHIDWLSGCPQLR